MAAEKLDGLLITQPENRRYLSGFTGSSGILIISATRQALAMFAFMSSGLLLAALADLLPVRLVYLFGAVLYLATACFALAQPSLRRARLAVPPGVTTLALADD